MRNRIIILAFIIFFAISAVFIFALFPWGSGEASAIVLGRGNTSGNRTAGGGLTAYSDGWVFIVLGQDRHNPLYKMRADGSERRRVSPDNTGFRDINVVGDWIYFRHHGEIGNNRLGRMRTDGTEFEYLTADPVHRPLVYDGWIYFVSYRSLYRMKTDGTGREAVDTKESDILILWFDIADDWLFFTEVLADGDRMYKIPLGGGERVHFGGVDPCLFGIMIYDGFIFFKNFYDTNHRLAPIYKMRLDGSGLTQVAPKGKVRQFNIADGWIYYTNDEFNLYRVRIDGAENQPLLNSYVRWINTAGDWLYYARDGMEGISYRVRIDGTAHESLIY